MVAPAPQRQFFAPDPPLLVCPTCNHRDTLDFCSRCGDRLIPEHFSVSGAVWKHMIHDRLVDGFAMIKTSWLMAFSPIVFFGEVLQKKGNLAQRPFFLTSLWSKVSRGPQKVLDPVKFLLLAGGLSVVLGWFATSEPSGLSPLLEEVVRLAVVLVQILMLWLYSWCLSLMLRGRVGTAELTHFMLYVSGLTTLLSGFVAFFGGDTTALLVLTGLSFLVSIVVPYVALPPLYGFTRKALFAAQFGVLALITGSFALIFGLGVLVYSVVDTMR